MSVNTPISSEQTLAMIQQWSKENPGSKFMVRVQRKKPGSYGIADWIATLADVELQHLLTPEAWLPQLLGGGDITMRVTPMDRPEAQIGGTIAVPLTGAPRPVRIDALNDPDWVGPPSMPYPKPGMEPPRVATAQQATIGANGALVTPLAGVGVAPGLAPAAQAPAQPTSYDLAREREMSSREADARLKEMQSQMRAEFDRAQREAETRAAARIADLERRESERIATAKQPSMMENVAALAAVLMPLVKEFAADGRAARAEAASAPARAEEARAAAMREQTAAQLKMMSDFQSVLAQQTRSAQEAAAARPGIAPEFQMVMELMKSQATGSADMMSRMVDAMGTVSKTSVGMIEAIADLRLGDEPENPILGAVREGVKALTSLSKGAETGARKIASAQQQQVATVASAAQLPAGPAQAQPANGATQRQAPAPNMPPASDAKPAAPAPQPRGLGPDDDPVAILVHLIQKHYEPVEEVARFFIAALKHPKMIAALNAVDNDPSQLIAEHLGAWILSAKENQDYIEKLGTLVEQYGVEAGIFEPDSDDDDGGDADEPQAQQ